jgi:hypothetical protein
VDTIASRIEAMADKGGGLYHARRHGSDVYACGLLMRMRDEHASRQQQQGYISSEELLM